jgi:hypothetical protein
MAKAISTLDWCIVRLGDDHNWWVAETSDPVRWDVDGLSIVDPRQLAHLIEMVDPVRDYGFDQDIFEAAFIRFRIDKDLGDGKVRLKRVKDSVFDSEEKLFVLADVLDEENGPYADLLVDEVEDEIREDQNSHFIQGKAIHTFEELTAILDYMPAGYDSDEEAPAKGAEDEETDDVPELDEAEEEKLKNDESLKWDEEEEGGEAEKPAVEGEKKKKKKGAADDDDGDADDEDEEDEDEDDEDSDDDDDDGEEKPKKKTKSKR